MTEPAPAMGWCPFPDTASAEAVIATLLDERLIACANIVPGLISHYLWNGERASAQEVGVILKLNERTMERCVTRLKELHPYDEPAILAWRCDAASEGTVRWLGGLAG